MRLPRAAGLLAVVVLVPLVAPGASGRPGGADAPASRVVLLSIDGAADWIVDRLIGEGRAPAFAAMARTGAAAEALIGGMPSLTAPAHATLWTGTWSRRHGVAGNAVTRLPRSAHTVLESENGFGSAPLDAEPIWAAAARAGRHTLVLQASGGYPFSGAYPDRLIQFEAYMDRPLDEAMIDGRLTDGRDRLTVGDTTVTIARDGDGLHLEATGGRWRLVPGLAGQFTPPVGVRVGGRDVRVRFRLIAFEPETGAYRLFRGAGADVHASEPALREAFLASAGAPVGEIVAGRYRRGEFGPTIPEGGGGEAERWVRDILEANQEYFTGSLRYAATRPWDLLVAYIPNFDAAMHALVGMVDPSSARHSPALERRIWPLVQDLFDRLADDYVAELRRLFPDATLVVASDHGFEGAGGYLLPNVALRRADLLAVNADGRIDLPRTRAVFQQARGPMIFVNTTDWKDGIVPPEDLDEVKRAVTTALLSMRDPRTGRSAIRAVYDPHTDGVRLGIGGPRGGDLYFDPAPGLYTAGLSTGDRDVIEAGPAGDGFHGVDPERRKMQSIFYAVGPGVSPGRRLGLVSAVDVAPTVAALLGIPPPADAVGRPLDLRPATASMPALGLSTGDGGEKNSCAR